MLTVLIHMIVCLGLAGVAGFLVAWLWRGIDHRESLRQHERNWQGMVAARDNRIREAETAAKKAVAALAAKQADLDTLKAGYAETEAMFEQDLARKTLDAATAQTRVAMLERAAAGEAKTHAEQLAARDADCAAKAELLRQRDAKLTEAVLEQRALRVLAEAKHAETEQLRVLVAAAEKLSGGGPARVAALEAELTALVDLLARAEADNRMLQEKLQRAGDKGQ